MCGVGRCHVLVYDDTAQAADRRCRREEEIAKLWFCNFISLLIVVFLVELCPPNTDAVDFIASANQSGY